MVLLSVKPSALFLIFKSTNTSRMHTKYLKKLFKFPKHKKFA